MSASPTRPPPPTQSQPSALASDIFKLQQLLDTIRSGTHPLFTPTLKPDALATLRPSTASPTVAQPPPPTTPYPEPPPPPPPQQPAKRSVSPAAARAEYKRPRTSDLGELRGKRLLEALDAEDAELRRNHAATQNKKKKAAPSTSSTRPSKQKRGRHPDSPDRTGEAHDRRRRWEEQDRRRAWEAYDRDVAACVPYRPAHPLARKAPHTRATSSRPAQPLPYDDYVAPNSSFDGYLPSRGGPNPSSHRPVLPYPPAPPPPVGIKAEYNRPAKYGGAGSPVEYLPY